MKLNFNALSLLLGAAIISPMTSATTPLWFEVEVVLFERLGEKSQEKFVEQIKQFNTENSIKVQENALYPKLDLCPTLTQFERFNIISAQKVVDDTPADLEQTVIEPTLLTTTVEENIPEISVVECTAPDDTLLRQAYDVLTTRLAAIDVANEENNIDVITTATLPSLIIEEDIVDDSLIDNDVKPLEGFDPNVFVPYPQRFAFNGVEYSSTPRVIINKVPTVIAQVIAPVLLEENPELPANSQLATVPQAQISNEVIDELPILVHTPDSPYLLDKSRLEMTELVQKLRWQKTSKPLLHLGWRQPMVSRELAVPVHLFAGKDYSSEYDQEGNNKQLMREVQEEAALLNNEESLLGLAETSTQTIIEAEELAPSTSITEILAEVSDASTTDTTPLWQLDGLLKIYLNRFLFIEPNFDFRKVEQVKVIPETNTAVDEEKSVEANDEITKVINNIPQYVAKLTSHPMSQHRRVRSKEVHYFDHPTMGMIIQIRRFEIPEEAQEQE